MFPSILSALAGILAVARLDSALAVPLCKNTTMREGVDVHANDQEDHGWNMGFTKPSRNEPFVWYFFGAPFGDANQALIPRANIDIESGLEKRFFEKTCMGPDYSKVSPPTRRDTEATNQKATALKDQAMSVNYPNAKLPIEDLPQCYQTCLVDNCCNMMVGAAGAADVRQMTTQEFCRPEGFQVRGWVFDHIHDCVTNACDETWEVSRSEAAAWMTRVCGGEQ